MTNNEVVFREKPLDQVADEESVGTRVENRQKKKQREPVFSSWLGGWTTDHLESRQGGDPTMPRSSNGRMQVMFGLSEPLFWLKTISKVVLDSVGPTGSNGWCIVSLLGVYRWTVYTMAIGVAKKYGGRCILVASCSPFSWTSRSVQDHIKREIKILLAMLSF